jgi:hypothetical protein
MSITDCGAGAIAIALAALVSSAALAVEGLQITGTYMQNRPCHGDGTDAKPLLVTIGEDAIEYRGGTCTLTDKQQDGNKVSMRATCKSRTGTVLSGDISFTLRDDKSLEMIDQDKAYRTVLNRCPQ